MFTIETFKQALPAHMRKGISVDVMNQINASVSDPDVREHMLDNILSFTSVLAEGRFKMESYLDGVKYVSYKTMGDSNIQAWTKVFPDRYARLVANNASDKEISAHVAMYNSTKIITLLMEQTLRPIHIMNAHHVQAAVNKLADLMANSKSDKVQMESADRLLTHLKQPEVKSFELNVGMKDDGMISELKDIMAKMAVQQRDMIQSGVTTARDAAHQRLVIEGEVQNDI